MSAIVDHGTTRDGLVLLRRRWKPAGAAKASVLLVHGLGEHTGRYEAVGDQFAAAGFDVVAFDQRGFGKSGGRRGHVDSFTEFVDDVEDQLKEVRALGLPVVLLGHSMGGLIATAYCVENRELPDLLVLSGPALGAEVNPVARRGVPILRRLAPHFQLADEMDETSFANDPTVGQVFMKDPLRVAKMTASLAAEFLSTIARTRSQIDKLSIPTYCLHGRDDKLVPVDSSAILESVPGVTRRVLDGSGHEIFNEPNGSEAVADIIRWVNVELTDLG